MSDLKQIHFRVTDDVLEEIKFQMDFLSCGTMSGYFKYLILSSVLFRVDYTGFYKLTDAINAIGNNINQIAWEVNKTGGIEAEQINELRNEFRRLDKEFAKLSILELRLYEYLPYNSKFKKKSRDMKVFDMRINDGIHRKIISGELYRKKIEVLNRWLLSDSWELPKGVEELKDAESKTREVTDLNVDELLNKKWSDFD